MCGTNNMNKKQLSPDAVINLDHGDPTMFEEYWQKMGEKCTLTISVYKSLSYFSDPNNICWFMEAELGEEIRRLHDVVGNAVTDNRHIIVGTGSSQLFQAALFALSTADAEQEQPMNVVSAIPHYSSYPTISNFLKSGLYQWAGDANTYDKDEPYIEVVCSPNNPDGVIKEPAVVSGKGSLIYDLAYYWPQYTAITTPAEHDLMLFTFSKCTGHAGDRIGWAIVKDLDVAKRMVKFIELNTIGVSKASQLRAVNILRAVTESCENSGHGEVGNFFEYGRHNMTDRWERLRDAIKNNGLFTLPNYPTEFCSFSGEFTEAHPPFAWFQTKEEAIEDCSAYLKDHKILTRSGKFFGMESRYARVSMLDRQESFELFLERVSAMKSTKKGE